MERSTEKRRKLKRRLLLHIAMILTVSMVVSTAASFFYFNQIARKQVITDIRSSLDAVSGQMEYMLEDVENFCKSMIVDESLQAALEEKNPASEFERLKKIETISKRLAFYNGLRLFVGGSFLEGADGTNYSSISSSQSQDYMEKKMAQEELIAFREHPEWTFSDPYYGIDAWSSWKLICFRMNIMDKYHFGERQGTVYTEINLDYFLEPIENYSESYDNVCLTGNDGILIYEKEEGDSLYERLLNMPQLPEEGLTKTGGGYVLCREMKGTGWKLYTWISAKYLWQRSSYVLEFFFLSFLLSLTAILVATSRLLEGIIHPIVNLSRQMEKTDYEKLVPQEVVQTGDEIQTLYECYNAMIEEIQRGIEDRIRYERQKQEMEFDIMLSQINPHYLYNVLNTVVYLSAAGKNREVSVIANSLIYSLQETLRLGEKNIETTVEKELELTRCYLNIQKYRYPDQFEVKVECEESLLACIVPKTVIQPLVENAILHGILPTEEKGRIQIRIEQEEECLYIFVIDDGAGISDEVLDLFEKKEKIVYEENGRKHIGISNVRDRIEYLYGGEYGMTIRRREEGGTIVTLALPFKADNKDYIF